ncbi:hypothetical protein QL185_07430 [Cronobacter malonaticus]|uniref:RipA family octameric membrane protein n=1 Tax=Cronobacter malonaticus TaxID=413503 RepID=UPI001A29EE1D|nr:hypothetical protein [Cronobacter malonaticus]MDI6459378.1 hypothetical protein [Cronobacter malonaticus]HAU5429408.1 hypothetical protein [Cronobacter malonaticus]
MNGCTTKEIRIREKDRIFFREFIGCDHCIIENSIEHKKIISAMDKAHDIRKFEIELYWKRATYFFAFFTIIAAAFGFLFIDTNHQLYSPGVAIVGTVFAMCFYYVNEGSKYWQRNWESIIDRLEFYVTGNLYKIFSYGTELELRPSVSHINKFISSLIIGLWLVCFILSLIQVGFKFPLAVLIYIMVFLILIFITVVQCRKTVSDVLIKSDNEGRTFNFRKPTHYD